MFKATANEETLLRKHCCFLNVSPFARTGNICCGNIFLLPRNKKMFLTFFRNILFFQQMFPRLRGEETMFPQQRFRNNVSSFAGAFRTGTSFLLVHQTCGNISSIVVFRSTTKSATTQATVHFTDHLTRKMIAQNMQNFASFVLFAFLLANVYGATKNASSQQCTVSSVCGILENVVQVQDRLKKTIKEHSTILCGHCSEGN